MGACMSSGGNDEGDQKKRSQMIDRGLEEDSKKLRRECKILLLGSGESGKSTIVKQMKIIHQNGYTNDELALYRHTIFKNLVDCAKALIGAMRQFEIEVENPANKQHCDFLMEHTVDPDPNANLDPRAGQAVASLWKDPCISKVFDHQNEFYLMDSAPYFFDEVDRIASPDYTPTEADVLRARTKTTGIYETRFQMGQLSIHMFDVGGQRSERKKWIHCFENVTTILFLVAISEYDQLLFEDETVNRMQEALTLFDSICNSRWFTKTSIILFLNKIDRFKEKLPVSPMKNYFPDYEGGQDYGAACDYILNRFVSLNQHPTKQIYTHFTCATDTMQIRFVMAAVNDIIIQENLRMCGLI